MFLGISLGQWVTIAVAVIALAGVLLAQWNARVVLQRQLDHDSEQRDRERTMSLRREVYLEAAVALSHITQVLGRVSSLQYEMNALSVEFADDLAKLAKVHMVGTEGTVEAVMTYVNAVGPAFLELLTQRLPIMLLQTRIDAEADPTKKAMLSGEQARAILAAGELGIALAIGATRLLPNAVLAVRKEMDLPLDRVLYERLCEVQYRSLLEAWARAKAQLERLAED